MPPACAGYAFGNGAIGQATERVGVGTGVTAPVYRYNPAVVAQFVATLEELFPGRAYLGIGSGESLNESPCGMDWPSTGEQVARMDEALEIVGRLSSASRTRPGATPREPCASTASASCRRCAMPRASDPFVGLGGG
jgi:alkanesulfonate monooxygenase SsuD/methylene tetrahydromethanopterin reductase-like flavin-dependent oxidoreductase (luciferase family)